MQTSMQRAEEHAIYHATVNGRLGMRWDRARRQEHRSGDPTYHEAARSFRAEARIIAGTVRRVRGLGVLVRRVRCEGCGVVDVIPYREDARGLYCPACRRAVSS